MPSHKHFGNSILFLLILIILLIAIVSGKCSGQVPWLKMNPPPDVNSTSGTSWLAVAANMLAGAGYGHGLTVQDRAGEIFSNLVGHFGTSGGSMAPGGFVHTALIWWLNSSYNVWPENPYDQVIVSGGSNHKPLASTNGPRDYISNILRNGDFVAISVSGPEYMWGSSMRHFLTCWGDEGDDNPLTTNPATILVTDSQRDSIDVAETYTFDFYTYHPSNCGDSGNGWSINYFYWCHLFIEHIISLRSTDDPGDYTKTQKFIGTYTIHQLNQSVGAIGLRYYVHAFDHILSYKTSVDWYNPYPPVIIESGAPRDTLRVHWNFSDVPVPSTGYVKITTEIIVPEASTFAYANVHFIYPLMEIQFPMIKLKIKPKAAPAVDEPNIVGGYWVGSFDVIDPQAYEDPPGSPVPAVVGQSRFQYQYHYDQDPEDFDISLVGDPNQDPTLPYEIANVRFGHNYGELDEDELASFHDWMTVLPDKFQLSSRTPIEINVDWEGRLPYPNNVAYTDDFQPPPCTVYHLNDFNHDCIVNLLDFARFAEAYLTSTLLDPDG